MPQEPPAVDFQEVESSSTSNDVNTRGNQELLKTIGKFEDFKTIDEPDSPRDAHNTSSMQLEAQEGVSVCRICQCADPDKAGEAALKSLGISLPETKGQVQCVDEEEDKAVSDVIQDVSLAKFSVSKNNSDEVRCLNGSIIELGCACKGDLSLTHYACALRWFVSKDSLICEICGAPASTIRVADRDKVISTLREKYMLVRSVHGEASSQSCSTNLITSLSSVCGGAALDVVSWFDPHGNLVHDLSRDPVIDIPEERQPSNSVSSATKWAVEGTGILIATGLLTVTITWLLAPRVSKEVARRGFNVLLAGLCALAIVVFLRFGVLPRIKYGPARYWAILVVFWFLIFGVWASSTRNARSNP